MPVLRVIIVLALMALFETAAFAADAVVSFPELWSQVLTHSPTLKAAASELEAATTAAARGGRHWFPYLYLEGRAFKTNDPGVSLFSTLSQRQMVPTDFSPDRLNHPDEPVYEKFTLGANLPIFEGGARVAGHAAAERMRESKDLGAKASKVGVYSESARLYGSLLSEQKSASDLAALADVLDQVIGRYRIGAKDNPVGYSGLLGLKGVRNRVAGALLESRAKSNAAREALANMAVSLPPGWRTSDTSPAAFVEKYLAVTPLQSSTPKSFRTQAFERMAQGAEQSARAERAKFLPRIGFFAEGNLNHGDRDSATSYVGGAYLQWDLFVAPNFGAVHQAESLSAAAWAHAEEAVLHERTETQGSLEAAEALEKNLKILAGSSVLLDEQTQVAKRLFLSGAMNALQLAEVLNRRVDLIAALENAEAQYLGVRATLANNLNYPVPGVESGE